MKRSFYSALLALIIVFATSAFFAVPAAAQGRLNDKDVERIMNNLKEDAKKFRDNFDNAVRKSTVRKTSQEKEARQLVKIFVKQTSGMHSHFKSRKKAESELQVVTSTARQVDDFLTHHPLSPAVENAWGRVRSELDTLGHAFQMEN